MYVVAIVAYISISILLNHYQKYWVGENIMHFITSQYFGLFFLSLMLLFVHYRLMKITTSKYVKGGIVILSLITVIISTIFKIEKTSSLELEKKGGLEQSVYYVDVVYLIWSSVLSFVLLNPLAFIGSDAPAGAEAAAATTTTTSPTSS